MILAVAMGALVGCGRPRDDCEALLEAGDHAAAAVRCEAELQRSGDPQAGYHALRARAALGQDEAVLELAARLDGTDQEPAAQAQAAVVLQRRGESAAAADHYRRALELYRGTGDDTRTAWCLYGLAYLDWEASRYRPALARVAEARALARRAGAGEMERRADRLLYSVLYAIGDLEGARLVLEGSGTARAGLPAGERARWLHLRAILHLDAGRPEVARDLILRALAEGADLEDRRFHRATRLNLVKISLDAGDLTGARQWLAQAWEHAEPDGRHRSALLYYQARLDRREGRLAEAGSAVGEALAAEPVRDWAWDLAHELGRVEEESGRLAEAAVAYRRAADEVEALRAELGLDDLKPWLLEAKRRPFESLFRLEVRAGRIERALDVAERARARTFLDAFVAGGGRRAAGGGTDPGGGEDALTAAGRRLEGLESLLSGLASSPVTALRPVPDLLAALGPRRALSYFQAGEEVWLLAAGGAGREAVRLPWRAEDLAAAVDGFAARPDDGELARRLGDTLLPASLLPSPGTALFLVTDGPLGRLPFAALRLGEDRLIERYDLVFAPSLNALAALVALERTSRGGALVLADAQGDLPGAGREAREVAGLTGATLYLGDEATAGRLLAAGDAGVLHLAAHTGLDARGPWVELADRRLAADEIVAAGTGPELAVLASCASAARAGDGLWGSLGAAFLAAGSRNVVATLTAVEDAPTRELLLRFYRAGGARDPARGLAAAQRWALGEGWPAATWAQFVVFGAGSGG